MVGVCVCQLGSVNGGYLVFELCEGGPVGWVEGPALLQQLVHIRWQRCDSWQPVLWHLIELYQLRREGGRRERERTLNYDPLTRETYDLENLIGGFPLDEGAQVGARVAPE